MEPPLFPTWFKVIVALVGASVFFVVMVFIFWSVYILSEVKNILATPPQTVMYDTSVSNVMDTMFPSHATSSSGGRKP